jgi:hypothetical protein
MEFFPIQVHPSAKAFFSVAIVSEVGNGKNTFFGPIDGCMGKVLTSLCHIFLGQFQAEPRNEQFQMPLLI